MSWRGVWSQECIACHNTLPHATMLYDELYGPGLPAYQGKLSDRVLPPSRMWPARRAIEPALARALADEIRFLGGEAACGRGVQRVLPAAATDDGEAARRHAPRRARHRLRGLPQRRARARGGSDGRSRRSSSAAPLFDVTPPRGQAGTRAQWINHTCAKCHTVLFTHYPWTWEGGERKRSIPGGSSTSSGEGRDYQLGGCSTQMACTACHDPHAADPREKLAALATPRGQSRCARSATRQSRPRRSRSTRITSRSAGRLHRVPHGEEEHGPRLRADPLPPHRLADRDRAASLGDRPLECALCHADKSVEQLVVDDGAVVGQALRPRRAEARCTATTSASTCMRATLERGKPHEQAVAIAMLGEAKDATAIAAIEPMLCARLSARPLLRAARAADDHRRSGRDRCRRAPPRTSSAPRTRGSEQWQRAR